MKNTPPFLPGAALLFWGWHTEHLIVAAGMALILEAARLLPFRWELKLSELNRVWLLCFILFGSMWFYPIAIVLFLGFRNGFQAIRGQQPFPVIFFPLLLYQMYSIGGTTDLRALSLNLQKKRRTLSPFPLPFNLAYPYVVFCCIPAIRAAATRTFWYPLGVASLFVWTFWSFRSRRYSPIVWIGLFFGTGMLGYTGFNLFHQINPFRALRQEVGVFRSISHAQNPYQSITAIGDTGTIELSSEVILRVRSESGNYPLLLLREASYTKYHSSNWYTSSSQNRFVTIPSEADETTWIIQPNPTPPPSQKGNLLEGIGPYQITVSCYLIDEKAILKLPTGTFRIEQLPVGIMMKNPLGVVQVEGGPGLLTYHTVFRQTGALDSLPDNQDLAIPETEQASISQFALDAQLAAPNPVMALQHLTALFQKDFLYSLELERHDQNLTPLGDFLLHTRSGHCEYFATAAVLLLRAVGIPARYVAGYAAENLREGEWQILRGRHAHAWALVYMDGVWYDFDPTPPSWQDVENAAASPFERISDLWYGARFAFSEWRWRERTGGVPRYLGWVLLPVFLILARRIYKNMRIKRITPQKDVVPEAHLYPGADSEFYAIEHFFKEQGFERYPGESLTHWLQRITKSSQRFSFQSLQPMLALHYRYRFDPEGLNRTEKAKLQSSVRVWIEQYNSGNSESK